MAEQKVTELTQQLERLTKELETLKAENKNLRDSAAKPITLRDRLSVKDILGRSDEGLGLVNQTIGVAGWVKTLREQGSGTLAFIELSDGSQHKGVQVVADQTTTGFDDLVGVQGQKVGTGASLFVKGQVVKSPAKGQKVEIKALEVIILGTCNSAIYPLSKKGHSLEHMRTFGHLRPRSNTIGAMIRVRNALAYATHRYFQQNGFVYLNSPIITASDCEGAGEMFQVTTLLTESNLKKIKDGTLKELDFKEDFFKKPAFLTVSGQLSGEAYACALSKIYTFGPTFRAENSHTTRHLAEFWMIEPEVAFADLRDNMDLAEGYLKFCINAVLDDCKEDLEFLESLEQLLLKTDPEKDQKQYKSVKLRERLRSVASQSFERLTYDKAVEIVSEIHKKTPFKEIPSWGEELSTAHEKYLAGNHFKKPVIVTNYPKKFKAFYMRLNEDGKTVAAMDVLVPGMGEIIGGSQREERLDVLESRIKESGLDINSYTWYLDLRRFGTVPHAGFGLGFERLVCYCTGLDNIRDAIPFPRYPGHAEF
eukprot:TRINITY_DN4713_c0_g1_i1.p1 TRINITY_DN4713_c0_g1~~TRINITY_DN4713_c0_g1_i1.p1  ORF type:complete len:537 (+),score=110.54 TRINITY_DN4713_c0_g1_i1:139-1749(+)